MNSKAEILKNVEEIIKAISEECKMISKAAIAAHGINDKVGADTLSDSNLYDELEVIYDMDAEGSWVRVITQQYILFGRALLRKVLSLDQYLTCLIIYGQVQ